MNEAVAQRLMRIARYRIRRWEDHSEYPDMLAEAYLRAWKSYTTALEKGMRYPFQIAALGAAYGPLQWLERWFGRSDRASARRQFEHVPLAEADHLPTPGPEEEVLNRLETAAAWEQFEVGLTRCTGRQRELLIRLYLKDETVGEIAQAWGVSHAAVTMVRLRAVAHCRPGDERKRRIGRTETQTHCSQGHELSGHNRMNFHRSGRPPAVRCRRCHNDSRQRCRDAHRPRPASEETASALLPASQQAPAQKHGEIAL